MLEVKELYYQIKQDDHGFGLQNINFKLERGYIMGLLGFNGAGKSTLMHLLMGMSAPDRGSVKFDGVDVWADTGRTRQKIACISERTEFLKYRTLEENAMLFGILYDLYDQERWEHYMDTFGLDREKRGLLYDDLSTGEKRKFQLAFALSYRPELLLLDEPTANLDPHARVEWMELLQNQVADEEISVIMATYLTADLDQVADYILVLDQGKQLEFMDREELMEHYGEQELSGLLLRMDEDKN